MAEPTYSFVLCDRQGAHLSTVANPLDRWLDYSLNRPCSAGFKAATADVTINGHAADGYPYCNVGDRTLKVFRNGVPVHSGIVWTTEETGEGDTSYVDITSFDPLQMLQHRMIRYDAVAGTFDKVIRIANYGADVIFNQINRTTAEAGDCYIDTSGHRPTTQYMIFEYRQEYLLRLITDICDTGTCDIDLKPKDHTDGTGLVQLNCYQNRGSDKSATVKFEFHTGAHTGQAWSRIVTLDDMANWIRNYTSNKVKKSQQTIGGSTSRYGRYESASVYSDIFHIEFLQALTQQELAERSIPRETVGMTPLASDTTKRYWDDFQCGDLVTVSSDLHTGIQRVYGCKVEVDNDGVERIEELRATANYGS